MKYVQLLIIAVLSNNLYLYAGTPKSETPEETSNKESKLTKRIRQEEEKEKERMFGLIGPFWKRKVSPTEEGLIHHRNTLKEKKMKTRFGLNTTRQGISPTIYREPVETEASKNKRDLVKELWEPITKMGDKNTLSETDETLLKETRFKTKLIKTLGTDEYKLYQEKIAPIRGNENKANKEYSEAFEKKISEMSNEDFKKLLKDANLDENLSKDGLIKLLKQISNKPAEATGKKLKNNHTETFKKELAKISDKDFKALLGQIGVNENLSRKNLQDILKKVSDDQFEQLYVKVIEAAYYKKIFFWRDLRTYFGITGAAVFAMAIALIVLEGTEEAEEEEEVEETEEVLEKSMPKNLAYLTM